MVKLRRYMYESLLSRQILGPIQKITFFISFQYYWLSKCLNFTDLFENYFLYHSIVHILFKLVANPCYARNVLRASIPPPPGSTDEVIASTAIVSTAIASTAIISTAIVNWPPPQNQHIRQLPQQQSSQQWSPQQWLSQQRSPQQWSSQQQSPKQWSPQQWSSQQWSPQQQLPQQWLSQQRLPQQWSSQQQSLIDPPPRISTWGNCLNSDCLNSNCLNSDCLNSDHLNSNHLNSDCLNSDCLNSDRLNSASRSTSPLQISTFESLIYWCMRLLWDESNFDFMLAFGLCPSHVRLAMKCLKCLCMVTHEMCNVILI